VTGRPTAIVGQVLLSTLSALPAAEKLSALNEIGKPDPDIRFLTEPPNVMSQLSVPKWTLKPPLANPNANAAPVGPGSRTVKALLICAVCANDAEPNTPAVQLVHVLPPAAILPVPSAANVSTSLEPVHAIVIALPLIAKLAEVAAAVMFPVGDMTVAPALPASARHSAAARPTTAVLILAGLIVRSRSAPSSVRTPLST
jgi:hypothetical protein